jgi:hypothetical protein
MQHARTEMTLFARKLGVFGGLGGSMFFSRSLRIYYFQIFAFFSGASTLCQSSS